MRSRLMYSSLKLCRSAKVIVLRYLGNEFNMRFAAFKGNVDFPNLADD